MKQLQSQTFAHAYEHESIEPFLANVRIEVTNSAIVAEALESMDRWARGPTKIVDVPADLVVNALESTTMAEGLFFMDRVDS